MDKRIQKKKHKEEKKTATDKPPNHNKNHPKAKAKTGKKKDSNIKMILETQMRK